MKTLQILNTSQQLKWIRDLFSKEFSTTEAKNELKNKKQDRKSVDVV